MFHGHGVVQSCHGQTLLSALPLHVHVRTFETSANLTLELDAINEKNRSALATALFWVSFPLVQMHLINHHHHLRHLLPPYHMHGPEQCGRPVPFHHEQYTSPGTRRLFDCPPWNARLQEWMTYNAASTRAGTVRARGCTHSTYPQTGS